MFAAAINADAVVVEDWLLWIWRAWHRLTHDRPWVGGGMGPAAPGRIPWTAVQRWCEHHAYGEDEAAMLDRCLAAMDETYLGWYAEQAKAASK